MYKRNNNGLSVSFLLYVTAFLVMPFVSSCRKSGTVSSSAINTRYQIINLSPDLGSVDLYINYVKVNSNSYFYPTASGYFSLASTTLPFQIRPGTSLTIGTISPSANIFTLDSVLKPNLKYTLMIIGLARSNNLDKIFTADTTSLPTIGRGKIRFINASPLSAGLDISANNYIDPTLSNIVYKQISNYVELPAGNYNFQIFPHGSSIAIQDPKSVIVQDGGIYTLYCYGLAGHTDSLAFNTGVIINR